MGRRETFPGPGECAHAILPAHEGAELRGIFARDATAHEHSNNTVYADADGHIAYWHGNFVPRRDPNSIGKIRRRQRSATEWQGSTKVSETISLFNPASGWIANSNNWPFTAAGPSSPRQQDFPPICGRRRIPRAG